MECLLPDALDHAAIKHTRQIAWEGLFGFLVNTCCMIDSCGWVCATQATMEAVYLLAQAVLYVCIVYFTAGFAREASE